MPYGYNRMIKKHTRPSIPHHVLHLPTHFRTVTMHRTPPASRLIFTEMTFGQPTVSIFQQFFTLSTELAVAFLTAAVKPYHKFNSASFVVYDR